MLDLNVLVSGVSTLLSILWSKFELNVPVERIKATIVAGRLKQVNIIYYPK